MRWMVVAVGILVLLSLSCSKKESASKAEKPEVEKKALVDFDAPEPLAVPERVVPSGQEDWPARINNKQAEIIEVINIINPVASYVSAALEQHGDKLGPEVAQEWQDTQARLAKANELYDACKVRLAGQKYDSQLYLDLEETWRQFIDVGAAAVRTKSLVDAQLAYAGS